MSSTHSCTSSGIAGELSVACSPFQSNTSAVNEPVSEVMVLRISAMSYTFTFSTHSPRSRFGQTFVPCRHGGNAAMYSGRGVFGVAAIGGDVGLRIKTRPENASNPCAPQILRPRETLRFSMRLHTTRETSCAAGCPSDFPRRRCLSQCPTSAASNLLRHFHGILGKMGLPFIPGHNLRHSSITVTLNTCNLLSGVSEEATQNVIVISTQRIS